MKLFYVRPGREGGYGKGDGTSYEDAWNGFRSIDWDAVAAAEPATVWVCGRPEGQGRGGFTTVHVELSYLQTENDIERPEKHPDPRREPAVAV